MTFKKRLKKGYSPLEFKERILNLANSLSPSERNYENFLILQDFEGLVKNEKILVMSNLPSYLPGLPFEVLLQIFLFLEMSEAFNVSLVCKQFNEILFVNQIHMKLRVHCEFPSLKGIKKLEDAGNPNFSWGTFLRLKYERKNFKKEREEREKLFYNVFKPDVPEFQILKDGLLITKDFFKEENDEYKQWNDQEISVDGLMLDRKGKVCFYFTYEHKLSKYYGPSMVMDPFDIRYSNLCCCLPGEEELIVDVDILSDGMTNEWAKKIYSAMTKIRDLIGFGEELSEVSLFDFLETEIFNVKDFIDDKLYAFFQFYEN